MKHVAVFFLFLFAYLAGMCHYAPTGDMSRKTGYTEVSSFEKKLAIDDTTAKQDLIQTEDTGLNGKNAFEIGVEDDDEDIIEKHISLVKYTLAFSHASASAYRSSCLANQLPVYNHVPYTSSCKYILQRALRL